MTTIELIAIVYNQKQNLKSFFASLNSQNYKVFTVYLVDNNSRDGSYNYARNLIESLLLKIKYINLSKNTDMQNNALAKGGCKYLFILNGDMILDINCLGELVRHMEADIV